MSEPWWSLDDIMEGIAHGYRLVSNGYITTRGTEIVDTVSIRKAYIELINKARKGSSWHRDTYIRSSWLHHIDSWCTPDWFITKHARFMSRVPNENDGDLIRRVQQQALDGCPVAQKAIHHLTKERLLGNC